MSKPPRGNAPDWSMGRYEDIAAQLEAAASAVVERARLRPGERVVDIGCGTGSAALLAAAEVEQHTLAFISASPEARLEAEIAHHPLAVAGAAVLAAHGRLDSVRDAALDVPRADNEDPSAFRATSRYVIAAASR